MVHETRIVMRTTKPAFVVEDEVIKAIVYRFYDKVRAHSELAPVFDKAIDDWEPHLATMVNFWSSIMNTSGRYKGQPMPKHMALPDITPDHFKQWLSLFGETVAELCTPEISARFVKKSEMIAKSFQLGIFGLEGLKKPTPPPAQTG